MKVLNGKEFHRKSSNLSFVLVEERIWIKYVSWENIFVEEYFMY